MSSILPQIESQSNSRLRKWRDSRGKTGLYINLVQTIGNELSGNARLTAISLLTFNRILTLSSFSTQFLEQCFVHGWRRRMGARTHLFQGNNIDSNNSFGGVEGDTT